MYIVGTLRPPKYPADSLIVVTASFLYMAFKIFNPIDVQVYADNIFKMFIRDYNPAPKIKVTRVEMLRPWRETAMLRTIRGARLL